MGGAEAYISDQAPRLIGNRRVDSRGVRYRGGVSPEEAVSRTTADFAALSDAEKDAWTARANGDDLRGPADRANQAAYQQERDEALNGRRGRPVATPAAAPVISDGGSGFTGTRARGIAMRTPDQVAARIANSPVSVTGRPIATIRQSTANNYDPAAYKANVALDGKLIAPTPGAAPASATATTTGGVRMNDSLHNRPVFDAAPAKPAPLPAPQPRQMGAPVAASAQMPPAPKINDAKSMVQSEATPKKPGDAGYQVGAYRTGNDYISLSSEKRQAAGLNTVGKQSVAFSVPVSKPPPRSYAEEFAEAQSRAAADQAKINAAGKALFTRPLDVIAKTAATARDLGQKAYDASYYGRLQKAKG